MNPLACERLRTRQVHKQKIGYFILFPSFTMPPKKPKPPGGKVGRQKTATADTQLPTTLKPETNSRRTTRSSIAANTREQEQCELTSTKMGPQTGGDGSTNIGNIHLLHPRISCTQAPTVAKHKRAPTTSEPTMGDGQHKSELLASTPLCLNPK